MQTILVVDDEQQIQALLVALLEYAGYRIITASNGQEALATLETTRPDLILSDIMMPGMNGFEVCRRLRANILTRAIPVVMLTSSREEQDLVRSYNLGVNAGRAEAGAGAPSEAACLASLKTPISRRCRGKGSALAFNRVCGTPPSLKRVIRESTARILCARRDRTSRTGPARRRRTCSAPWPARADSLDAAAADRGCGRDPRRGAGLPRRPRGAAPAPGGAGGRLRPLGRPARPLTGRRLSRGRRPRTTAP